MQTWIIGPDSYPHSHLQDSFSPRSSHIVEIGSESIVGIVGMYGSTPMKDFTLPRRDMHGIGPDSYPHPPP